MLTSIVGKKWQICLDCPAQAEDLVGSASKKVSVPGKVEGGGAGGVRGAKKRHFLYDALDFYNVSFVYILKSIDFNPLKSLHLVLSYFVLFSYRSFPSFWWR